MPPLIPRLRWEFDLTSEQILFQLPNTIYHAESTPGFEVIVEENDTEMLDDEEIPNPFVDLTNHLYPDGSSQLGGSATPSPPTPRYDIDNNDPMTD